MKRSPRTGFGGSGWIVTLSEIVRFGLPLFWIGASAFWGFDVARKLNALQLGQWIGFIGVASILVGGTFTNSNDSLRTKTTVAIVAVLAGMVAFVLTSWFLKN